MCEPVDMSESNGQTVKLGSSADNPWSTLCQGCQLSCFWRVTHAFRQNTPIATDEWIKVMEDNR